MQSGKDPEWILGAVFLQTVYAVYNMDQQTIYFAQLSRLVGLQACFSDQLQLSFTYFFRIKQDFFNLARVCFADKEILYKQNRLPEI